LWLLGWRLLGARQKLLQVAEGPQRLAALTHRIRERLLFSLLLGLVDPWPRFPRLPLVAAAAPLGRP